MSATTFEEDQGKPNRVFETLGRDPMTETPGSYVADPHLHDRVARVVRDLYDLGVIRVQSNGASSSVPDALPDVVAVHAAIMTSLTAPLVPLNPQERAKRLVDRWMAHWGRIPSRETVELDVAEALITDREEVSKFGASLP